MYNIKQLLRLFYPQVEICAVFKNKTVAAQG